jgi:hypothetical protein
LCNFLHSPVTSFLLGPNILLRTLFSNIKLHMHCCSSYFHVVFDPENPGQLETRLFPMINRACLSHFFFSIQRFCNFSCPWLPSGGMRRNAK